MTLGTCWDNTCVGKRHGNTRLLSLRTARGDFCLRKKYKVLSNRKAEFSILKKLTSKTVAVILLCLFAVLPLFASVHAKAEEAPAQEDYVFDESSLKFTDSYISIKLPKGFNKLEKGDSEEGCLCFYSFTNPESSGSSVVYNVNEVDPESDALEGIDEKTFSDKISADLNGAEFEIEDQQLNTFEMYGYPTVRFDCSVKTADGETNKIIMFVQNEGSLIQLDFTFNDAERKAFRSSAESFKFPSDGSFEFELVDEFKNITTIGWIMIAAAAVLIIALIVYLVLRNKSSKKEAKAKAELPAELPETSAQKTSPTLILVHGALCIAMSFILSYFKFFSMPTGGSITLASMLPLMIYANRYGVGYGMLAGIVYGLLEYIQEPYMFHWIQLLLDYPIAFGLIGLGGITRGEKNLVFSVIIGGTGRFIAHLISGLVFFGKYVMIGSNAAGLSFSTMFGPNFVFSLVYNTPYMVAEIAICAVIAMLPPFRKTIKRVLKY